MTIQKNKNKFLKKVRNKLKEKINSQVFICFNFSELFYCLFVDVFYSNLYFNSNLISIFFMIFIYFMIVI